MTQVQRFIGSVRVFGSQLIGRFRHAGPYAVVTTHTLGTAAAVSHRASERGLNTHPDEARNASQGVPAARAKSAGRWRFKPQAEAATAATAAQLPDALIHEIVAQLPAAILLTGAADRIVFANASAAALLGYAPDELRGMPLDGLIPSRKPGHDADADVSAPEGIARRKDGTEFPALIVVTPLFSAAPANAARRLVSIVDRTERNELQRDRLQLAHLTRVCALGELAGSLAHELNQPLTAILSNAQAAQRFMRSEPIDLNEVREILQDLVDDNRRASEVIRKIRSLVQKGEVERAPLSIASVIGDVALLVHSDAVVRGITLSLSVAPDLPPVHGDRVQLQQVVINLLLNAFDAVEPGPPHKRHVWAEASADGENALRVAVRDNGPGVPAATFDKLFTPYYTSKREGLGLGLSISRSIVEMHGGQIWAESKPGQGAAFYFTLPAGLDLKTGPAEWLP